MKVFFTSDLHFGHENVLRFDNRPFETVEEMKECLKELKEMGQDMNYVNVFPPNTGFYGSDFLI